MPSLAIVVVLALAAFRSARFIAVDTLMLPLRESAYAWAWRSVVPGPSSDVEPRAAWRTYVYDLITCVHCLGFWFAIAAYLAWRYGGDVVLALLTVVAIAGAQSALASFTTKADV